MAGIRPKPTPDDYRLYQLESIAEGILKEAAQFVGPNRVDVESIILITFRIKIEAFYGLKRKWDTYAFHNVSANTIYVDAGLSDDDRFDKKYRFTLGEELAHWHIHKGVFGDCQTIEDRIEMEKSIGDEVMSRIDAQARVLASAILIPKKTVELLVEGLVKNFTSDSDSALKEHLGTQIKELYDVNYNAALRRLKILGYHNRLGLDL